MIRPPDFPDRPETSCLISIQGRKRYHIARPKGGEEKAFDIPLSSSMIRCIIRAIRWGRIVLQNFLQ
jgi:hypothetical protein